MNLNHQNSLELTVFSGPGREAVFTVPHEAAIEMLREPKALNKDQVAACVAPKPALDPAEAAVIRDLLHANGRPEGVTFELRTIAEAGGYEAILRDPKQQDRLGDMLEPLIEQRIIDVRNALRDLGWDGPNYAPQLKKDGATFETDGHIVSHNAVAYHVIVKQGSDVVFTTEADPLKKPARDYAAWIDQSVVWRSRTQQVVEEELQDELTRKSRHEGIGSSFHFAESMAMSERISSLQKEIAKLEIEPTEDSRWKHGDVVEWITFGKDYEPTVNRGIYHAPYRTPILGSDLHALRIEGTAFPGGYTYQTIDGARMRTVRPGETVQVPEESLDLVRYLKENSFPNAACAIEAHTKISKGSSRGLVVALHNAAGLMNRIPGGADGRSPHADLFEATTQARVATERAYQRKLGANPETLDLNAVSAHLHAARIAGAKGHESFAALHQQLADWHLSGLKPQPLRPPVVPGKTVKLDIPGLAEQGFTAHKLSVLEQARSQVWAERTGYDSRVLNGSGWKMLDIVNQPPIMISNDYRMSVQGTQEGGSEKIRESIELQAWGADHHYSLAMTMKPIGSARELWRGRKLDEPPPYHQKPIYGIREPEGVVTTKEQSRNMIQALVDSIGGPAWRNYYRNDISLNELGS